MSATSHADIQKHVRTYVMVFLALGVLTGITVAVSYLHLTIVPAVLLALFIASIKGTLVAAYFMHLIGERKLIYWVLVICAVFFVTLLALPVLTSGR